MSSVNPLARPLARLLRGAAPLAVVVLLSMATYGPLAGRAAADPLPPGCTPPGVTVVTDPTGDALDMQPSHDAQSISVSEPWFGTGQRQDKLVFTLKMAGLSPIPPDTTWPISFVWGKNSANADQSWFVRMQTPVNGTTPTFTYGQGVGSEASLGSLDPRSTYSPDGTITLIIATSKLAPFSGGIPAAGSVLSKFLTRVRIEPGAIPDNMPDNFIGTGSYTLIGNNACAPQDGQPPSCNLPGVKVLVDTQGDENDQQAAHDLQYVSVAEPWFGDGVNKLVFTMKVASLASLPPDTTWPIPFVWGKTATNADQGWFVRMVTAASGGAPTFSYGKGVSGSPTEASLGALDPSSNYSADGTINMVISTDRLAPAQGGIPVAGSELTKFLVRIRVESAQGASVTPDNAPNDLVAAGSYVLVGNAACAPNRVPTAVLTADPTSGPRPLDVTFDGSGSTDPDNNIGSYTFNFGDGSGTVTQSTAVIHHIYTEVGDYHATLVVTDTGGLTSLPASQDIHVDPNSQDADLSLSVAKKQPQHPAVGNELIHDFTISNDGPAEATNVTLTDTLPSGTMVFERADTASGSCSEDSGTVTCVIPSISMGGHAMVKIVEAPTGPGTFTDQVSVSADQPDPRPSGNSLTLTAIAKGPTCTIVGTVGRDTLDGTGERDVMCGLGSADTMDGMEGNDTLIGGSGPDQLTGGSGQDVLLGNGGDDDLNSQDGVSGNDTVNGGRGTNTCTVDAGDKTSGC